MDWKKYHAFGEDLGGLLSLLSMIMYRRLNNIIHHILLLNGNTNHWQLCFFTGSNYSYVLHKWKTSFFLPSSLTFSHSLLYSCSRPFSQPFLSLYLPLSFHLSPTVKRGFPSFYDWVRLACMLPPPQTGSRQRDSPLSLSGLSASCVFNRLSLS